MTKKSGFVGAIATGRLERELGFATRGFQGSDPE